MSEENKNKEQISQQTASKNRAFSRGSSTKDMVSMAMLIALIVVLQMISALIPPIGGMVSITLTLIPVVVGGILLGKKRGAILGLAFGLIVLINCIAALDPGGNILWNTNPFFTALVCLIKGTAAGFFPAWIYELICGKTPAPRKAFVATAVAALSAPVINTGLFVCGMLLFFRTTLQAWAGGTNVMLYILVGLAGLNFLVEFAVNLVMCPAIYRIWQVVGHRNKDMV